MSNRTPWGMGLLVGFGLAATLAAGIAIGERPSSSSGTTERQLINSAVEEAGAVDFWAVVQKFSGSLEETDALLSEFAEHFDAQGLQEALKGFEPTAVIILPTAPKGAEAKGLIGLTVPGRLKVKEPLIQKRVRFSEAASVVHRGPYEGLAELHGAVASAAKGLRSSAVEWPVVLRLLNDPRLAKAPKTELVVPLGDPAGPVLARGELAAISSAVGRASPVSHLLVTQSFEGSPEQIGKFLNEFLENFTGQGLGGALGSRNVAPVAILHGDPDKNRSVGIEIGLPVAKKTEVKAPLKLTDFDLGRAVSYVHQGPYDELGEVHRAISQTADEKLGASHDFPVVLRLFSDPRLVPEGEIKTGVVVPLKG